MVALMMGVVSCAPPPKVSLKSAVTYYQGCESLKPNYEGEKVHPDPRLQPGRIGNAFLIEQRTVNLIADPGFKADPKDA